MRGGMSGRAGLRMAAHRFRIDAERDAADLGMLADGSQAHQLTTTGTTSRRIGQ